MLPWLIQMVMRVVRPGIVSNPRVGICVDVWRLWMPGLIAIRGPPIAFGRAGGPRDWRRSTRGNVPIPYGSWI